MRLSRSWNLIELLNTNRSEEKVLSVLVMFHGPVPVVLPPSVNVPATGVAWAEGTEPAATTSAMSAVGRENRDRKDLDFIVMRQGLCGHPMPRRWTGRGPMGESIARASECLYP